MLRHTFLHLPGIGKLSEARFWRAGLNTWDDLESRCNPRLGLFPSSRERLLLNLEASRRAFDSGEVNYFSDRLPRPEHYRVALDFLPQTIFVDIETTGLSLYYDYVTVVGWELDGTFRIHLRGESTEELFEAFSRAKAIVTFNGSLFDIPFLKKEFKSITVPHCHVDLRFLARRAGAPGGQKQVEDTLGIVRDKELEEVSGEAAPVLWHRYRWGSAESLRLLVSYNHADVQGLKGIFTRAAHTLIEAMQAPIDLTSFHKQLPAHTELRISVKGKSSSAIHLPRFKGNPEPLVTLRQLSIPESFRIVGIDLTGSESRPSGWCVLEDAHVRTLRIARDEELVDATIGAGAQLVSIDSPLSLPRGRSRVDDKDSTRAAFGITRECERLLRRRGINVYPCLLPSMQQLTARGIRLAALFRSKGVAVIESYPGAAQDIMSIPRKRASLELLALGLERFGICSDLGLQGLSHDELDAITSAIVGAFFWAGRYESLGNTEEEFLIVPNVSLPDSQWPQHVVVGLSGPISAGKTTAARHLEAQGFSYGRYSQVLQHIALERGIQTSRSVLQDLGREINQLHGQRWLGRRLVSGLPRRADLVIDGLRYPEDHAFLTETFGPRFRHIAVSASHRSRAARQRAGEELASVAGHPSESGIEALVRLAHDTIENEGSLMELEDQLESALTEYFERA